MKMFVLGAGAQGSACAYDILQHTDHDVTIADHRTDHILDFLKPYVGNRLKIEQVDFGDEGALRTSMDGHVAAMSAAPYYFNGPLARIAVEVGAHFSDLGGNTEIVQEQKKLDEAARKSDVIITPDCGLAPGMINILAREAIERLDETDSVKMFVGGLPQNPEPPLNYQIVYSLEGALDYYTTLSWVIREGKPTKVEALTELEDVSFEEPLGTLEAFHTAGGLSTMPWDYEGKVGRMEYKTLRYAGHAVIMKAIRDLGLLGMDPIDVKGTKVVPRDVFISTVDPVLRKPDSPDLVALKVVASGKKDGASKTVTFQLIDRRDEATGITAMMRTTGYSLAATGIMQADGRITERGVHTSFECTPYGEYVTELRKRGIDIREE